MHTVTTRSARDVVGRDSTRSTRSLLIAAALAGPVFYLSATAQILTREGFDLRVHPISQLSTGELGWIQTATFIIAGLGVLALAVTYRRLVTDGVGRRLVPIFLAVLGFGFVVAGSFTMDPQHGFPIGTPAGPAAAMSWHGIVHSVAAAVAFVGLAIACVTSMIRSIRERRAWAATGHGFVALVLLLPVSPTDSSLQIAGTGLIAFTWTTVTALTLRRSIR